MTGYKEIIVDEFQYMNDPIQQIEEKCKALAFGAELPRLELLKDIQNLIKYSKRLEENLSLYKDHWPEYNRKEFFIGLKAMVFGESERADTEIEINYVCPCGGKFEDTGVCKDSNPPIHVYACNKCEQTINVLGDS